MKVSVAHEWFTNVAGSELVMREFAHELEPSELIFSVLDRGQFQDFLPGLNARALWVDRLPGSHEKWASYALLMLGAWARVKIRSDLLVVSSHFAAHAATLRFDGPSVVYYHTPARIFWRPDIELARLDPRIRGPVEHLLLPLLRKWDKNVALSPGRVLANSSAVAERIRTSYGREATVLHPPVNVERWSTVRRGTPKYLLWVGRLVAYKRPDLAIDVASRTKIPLVIIGDGPDKDRLARQAPSNVHFLGRVDDTTVAAYFRDAIALLFPGEEDFGIAPVEALCAGVPVIAYGKGGAVDYVRHGENGLLVQTQTVEDFAEAVVSLHRELGDESGVRHGTEKFSRAAFRSRFRDILDDYVGSEWRPSSGRDVRWVT